MKSLLFCFILLVFGTIAFSHDYLLLPDEFFLSKGQSLNIHLFSADQFKSLAEKKYQNSKTSSFMLYEGGKKIDLKTTATDSLIPVFSRKMENSGLALISMERSSSEMEMTKPEFISYLQEEALDKILEKVETSEQAKFKEKYTRYLKTLITVDKASGGLYNEKLGHELEIILLQNPYKMMYGDDMVAQVLFKGKPLKLASVGVQTKGLNGTIFSSQYTSDTDGKIYFKLNRSGSWLVRLVHMEASADKGVDYQSWWASYSFGFK